MAQALQFFFGVDLETETTFDNEYVALNKYLLVKTKGHSALTRPTLEIIDTRWMVVYRDRPI